MSAGTFAERLAQVRERIAAACARAGRDPAGVTLLAVSKGFGCRAVAEAAAAGQVHFGENRVQEARDKIPLCPGGLTWHLVGTLQKNKAKDAARLFSWVHSIDSPEVALALNRRAEALGGRLSVLLEVKLSPEESKSGTDPAGAAALAEAVGGLPALEPRGLMAIPPFDPDPERSRPYFRELAALRREIAGKLGLPGFDQLSMGMSSDFEVAVEEGATIVRVGTAVFGARPGY